MTQRIGMHLTYLRYVLRHKFGVLYAGFTLFDVPFWRLVIHDWTKFRPNAEWRPYVDHFHGPNKVSTEGTTGYLHQPGRNVAFDRAWSAHWSHPANTHHPDAWCVRRRREDGSWETLRDITPTQMPEVDVREMLADHWGAAYAQHKLATLHEWYQTKWHAIPLHPLSRALAEDLLFEAYGWSIPAPDNHAISPTP
jgi:hypothetical protein